MNFALKAVAWAWRFIQTENDSPVFYVQGSCDSPVSYTPGSCKFDPLKIQNCPKYRGVSTPRCPSHRGVATPRFPKHLEVVLLFVWASKPMLLPLKQHSLKNLSKSNINYT